MNLEEYNILNIWLIQTGEPLPLDNTVKKMRTALLADILADRGHNVIWWTSAFDHFKKEWIFHKDFEEIEINKNLKIKAIKGIGYKKNISLSRFIDHRIIAKKFNKIASKMAKPDIIVSCLPPYDLAYEAVCFAKERNIPVLVDIRDPWPDIFLNQIPIIFHPFIKMCFFREFQMAKKAIQNANGLISVTESFLNWGLKYANRSRNNNDKIFYLGYKKSDIKGNFTITEKCRKQENIVKDKFIVFFVGTISESYHNPSILLDAAEKLIDFKKIHFIIAGDGPLLNKLMKKAKNFGNVSFTGWLDKNEIEFFLNHSKIGICPAAEKIDLPTNKAYCYLSSGLPLISAFQGELKNIIEENKIGFYYPPDNLEIFIESIKKLYLNCELYDNYSSNAKAIFEKMFNADKIYQAYANHIEEIFNDRKK